MLILPSDALCQKKRCDKEPNIDEIHCRKYTMDARRHPVGVLGRKRQKTMLTRSKRTTVIITLICEAVIRTPDRHRCTSRPQWAPEAGQASDASAVS